EAGQGGEGVGAVGGGVAAEALEPGARPANTSLHGLQRPVVHLHPPLEQFRQLRAVRHHDQHRLLLPVQIQQQLADRLGRVPVQVAGRRSEEHTSELQSRENLVCRLLLEKKKKKNTKITNSINFTIHTITLNSISL